MKSYVMIADENPAPFRKAARTAVRVAGHSGSYNKLTPFPLPQTAV